MQNKILWKGQSQPLIRFSIANKKLRRSLKADLGEAASMRIDFSIIINLMSLRL